MKLLKFFATWCAPCKTLTTMLESEDLGVEIVPIDMDQEPEKFTKYGIKSVPTLLLVDDEGNALIEPRRGFSALNRIKLDIKEYENKTTEES